MECLYHPCSHSPFRTALSANLRVFQEVLLSSRTNEASGRVSAICSDNDRRDPTRSDAVRMARHCTARQDTCCLGSGTEGFSQGRSCLEAAGLRDPGRLLPAPLKQEVYCGATGRPEHRPPPCLARRPYMLRPAPSPCYCCCSCSHRVRAHNSAAHASWRRRSALESPTQPENRPCAVPPGPKAAHARFRSCPDGACVLRPPRAMRVVVGEWVARGGACPLCRSGASAGGTRAEPRGLRSATCRGKQMGLLLERYPEAQPGSGGAPQLRTGILV